MDTLAVFMAWFLLTPRILAVAVAVAVAVVVAEAPGCERAVEVAGDLRQGLADPGRGQGQAPRTS